MLAGIYVKYPENIVDTYAIKTVVNKSFFALLPRSAILGATRPKIIRGMQNPKNWEKIPLKVRKTFIIETGRKPPSNTPNAMAINTFGNKPNFFITYISI